jgi:hypothetical protein
MLPTRGMTFTQRYFRQSLSPSRLGGLLIAPRTTRARRALRMAETRNAEIILGVIY